MNEQVRAHLGKIKLQLVKWLASADLPTAAEVETTQRDLNLLLYIIRGNQGWAPSASPVIGSPICSEPGCKAGWREGLINYAQPENDPVWYCIKHGRLPTVATMNDKGELQSGGGHRPPGSPPELKSLHARAVEMVGRWTAFEKTLADRLKAEGENHHFDWREQ